MTTKDRFIEYQINNTNTLTEKEWLEREELLLEEEWEEQMKTGNELWWSQVSLVLEEMPQGTHYREAETEMFYRLVHRMESDGLSQQVIRDHFKSTFNIGQSAFYSRLRKVGTKYVI